MPSISKWDAVVREIQDETGLDVDAFHESPDGVLIVTGTGPGGEVTQKEQIGILRVVRRRPGLWVSRRDGTVRIEGPDEDPGAGRVPDARGEGSVGHEFDFSGGGLL